MAKNELTKKQLSESYSVATLRLHNAITELYEDLHDDKGEPCINTGLVSNMISAVRVSINHELDLIKEASYQHDEANHDKSEQAELLFSNRKSS